MLVGHNFLHVILFIISFELLFPAPIFSAVAPTFSNLPSSINSSDIIEVDVNYCGDPKYYANKTYYLRGVFYQESGKYCSFTQNNAGNWVNTASDPTQLYQIQTSSEGSWSGKLKIKVDIDNNFNGSGTYQFKVGRYTAGGSVSWSESKTITINAPSTPTPPPTSSSTQSSSSNSSSESQSSDATPTESPTATELAIGVVAGAALGIKSSPSTLAADFDVSGIIDATPSSSSALESTPSSTATGSGKLVPLAIGGGSLLLSAAIAPLILKRYNIKLWEKLFQRHSSAGDRPSSGQD